jgi:dTDP-4-amino-4,6-dideoxygalactose transaminase
MRSYINSEKFNIYSSNGLLVRLMFDMFITHIGMSVGLMLTLALWINRTPETHGSLLIELIQKYWIANIPVLTLACLIGYFVTGLYAINNTKQYRKILIRISQAVLAALLIHALLLYVLSINMPRSMFISGWIYAAILIFAMRFLRIYFYKTYKVVPLETFLPTLGHNVKNLSVVTQQDGWAPPESLPANAAWPYFADDEVRSAATALRSGKVNQWTGREIEKFQYEFASHCEVKHAIALANGTLALELALRAFGIGPGDEVVVTPRTFIASASCAVIQGAIPVFADVDRESQNITAESINRVISPKTKAIIAVHLAGWPCEMDAIMALAGRHGITVIEDCAQAHGAKYKGKPVGSFGHAAAYSFCQDKIMTTGGEGGMFLTNDEAAWAAAWAFKDHGKSYESVYRKSHPPGFRWLHDSFGTNWRMIELQAAIGRVQLRKLPDWIDLRRRNAAILTKRLSGIAALRMTLPPPETYHSYYKYYVFVRPERLKAGWNRDRIMNAITAQNVPCFSGSCSEIYRERAFTDSHFPQSERLSVAKELGETSLMFLVHPTLSERDMHHMADAAEKVLAEAGL